MVVLIRRSPSGRDFGEHWELSCPPPPGREEVKPESPKKQEGSLHVTVTPFGVLKLSSGTHSLSLDAILSPPSLPASQSPPIPCFSSNAQKNIYLVSEPLLFP